MMIMTANIPGVQHPASIQIVVIAAEPTNPAQKARKVVHAHRVVQARRGVRVLRETRDQWGLKVRPAYKVRLDQQVRKD